MKKKPTIEEVSGYKLDGYPEIYDTYDEAYKAKEKIDKLKRHKEEE